MENPIFGDGWDVWKTHILAELQRLCCDTAKIAVSLDELRKNQGEMRTDLATQKVRGNIISGLLGIIGGAIPAAVLLLMQLMKK